MSTEVTVPGFDAELQLKDLSATIVAELAAGLATPDGIKERYGISDGQWELLRRSKPFRAMLKEAIEKFSGDLNAGKRITIKAEVALEDSLQVLYKLAHDRDIPAASRIDSIKTLAMLAGRTAKQGEGGPTGGGFAVNINIDTSGKAGVTIQGSGPAAD